jgi:hypothetical protein
MEPNTALSHSAVSILRHLNSGRHNLASLLRLILITSCHLLPGAPSLLLLSVSPIKIICPAYLPSTGVISLILCGELKSLTYMQSDSP